MKNLKNVEEKKMTPKEYFDLLKDKRHSINDEELLKMYDNCMTLMKKYLITRQIKGASKLMFHLETIEKEREIVKLGINSFVYKDDIEYFIDNVADDVVKIIELENYEREIPDDIVDVIAKVGDKFDKMYVLFTDYTGAVEREVAKSRREKDPILFGSFQDKDSRVVVDRFYFLGDWVDEYCDLTLDKMISQMSAAGKDNIVKNISTPMTLDEVRAQLKELRSANGMDMFRIS